jgi:hypothetical protein
MSGLSNEVPSGLKEVDIIIAGGKRCAMAVVNEPATNHA